MTVKSNIFTRVPKTAAGKEVFSFFLPGRYRRLMEKCVNDILVDYKTKVGGWDAVKGENLDRLENYDGTPFGTDKLIYAYLSRWHSIVKPSGTISFRKFSESVAEAKANDKPMGRGLFAPTEASRPLRLLLRCAWNLANERGEGKASASAVKVLGDGKARAIFTYAGISPYSDNLLDRFRPSPMKLIEQFAEFLGGNAKVETSGFVHRITIEMPVAKERQD